MYNMSQACCNINVVRLQVVSVAESKGCTPDGKGSSSWFIVWCSVQMCQASNGGGTDDSQALLLFSNQSHAFGQLHALIPLTGMRSKVYIDQTGRTMGNTA